MPVRSGAVRASIADFEVLAPWGRRGHRYVCRPPDRLLWSGGEAPPVAGHVMVTELAVDAEGWPQLCDALVRLASAPGDGLLEVIEVGPDLETGAVFLVTEAAEGGTLDHPEPSWAEPFAGVRPRVEAVAAVARTAHALHEVGLCHGTIHPGSILLTDRGPILDLPRLDGPAGEVAQARSWSELASISPELLAGEPPSRGSDVWALGATLHSLLSDRPLYPGIDEDEPVTAVQRVMFTRPERDTAIPSGLGELIEACLMVDPADRPSTAEAVSERLAAIGSAR